MSYDWSQAEYDRLPPAVQRVRALLEDWHRAIEDGRVGDRHPDPAYKPAIDEETVNNVIAHIDDRMKYELDHWASQIGYDATPDFGARLRPPQKLALVQQIRDMIHQAQEAA